MFCLIGFELIGEYVFFVVVVENVFDDGFDVLFLIVVFGECVVVDCVGVDDLEEEYVGVFVVFGLVLVVVDCWE